MKARRLIAAPEALDTVIVSAQTLATSEGADVRFGSKADICGAPTHVRFTPDSDRESGYPQQDMSALPLKADVCGATNDVC